MANTSLTTQKQTGIASYLSKSEVRTNIANVIGPQNVAKFTTTLVSAVQANPQLAQCTNSSLLNSALQANTLNLIPGGQLGEFHIIPFRTKKKIGNQWVDVYEAQCQIGWQGYVQLAIRTGKYKTIVVSAVKDGELNKYNPITEDIEFSPITDPAVREAAPTIGYYAMFRLIWGFEKGIYWPKETMESYARQRSSAYRYDLESGKKSSPWSTNFDAMAQKTMIKTLIRKWGVKSTEMQEAITNDGTVIDESGQAVYVDNQPNLEAQVQEDISNNANAKAFDEDVVETDVVEAEVSPAPEKPKRGRPKKMEEPVMEMPAEEPAPAPVTPDPELFPEMTAIDDDPDWA